jgi:N-glycosylase/DNA lyase
MAVTVRAPGFDLALSLESGQFFRWTRDEDGAYWVVRGPVLFRVRQDGELLYAEGADEPLLREFFGLDIDLRPALRELRRDPRLKPALERCRGLRILRQDPWECVAAFITSIASNIPRITRNVADIAAATGRPLKLGSQKAYAFPRPGDMPDEAALRAMKLGFRAAYLARAARLAASGLLEDVDHLPYDEAKRALMVLPGVAEKVADCVLLFAYGRLNAFPVDTWIRKTTLRLYFPKRRVSDAQLRAFAARQWGEHAGYAQQLLYHWSREGRTRLSKPESRLLAR